MPQRIVCCVKTNCGKCGSRFDGSLSKLDTERIGSNSVMFRYGDLGYWVEDLNTEGYME